MKTKFALLLLGLWLGSGAWLTARAQQQDFGDAPSPFPTLVASNGARHPGTGPRLGTLVDVENDGQPNATATGDDVTPVAADDEDGVFFLTPFFAGFTATIQVVVSSPAPARLDAWMDFNGNLSWADAGDVIASNRVVNPGTNIISFVVPAVATPGIAFARFRLSSQGGLTFTGQATDGEVEDYQFTVSPLVDFGDAPAPYPTLAANNGARHTNFTAIFLGIRADPELDGQPHISALGDDNNPAGADDEDGVAFLTPLVVGQPATVQIQASATGVLNAWMDFNADGDWADPGEQIFVNNSLTAGLNTRGFTVPTGARVGPTFARFRFSSNGGLSFTGGAATGEVEDYQVNIAPPTDFGDAPTNYPTLLAVNGARHVITNNFFLGAAVDSELDGQPDSLALGDDLNGAVLDEDGVSFSGPIIPGSTASVQVSCTMAAGENGKLDAWMDFNRDGDWADPNEKIFTNVTVINGANNLTFSVPPGATPGTTFTRFRLSRAGGLNFDGPAPDGEVEDYQVTISAPRDFGDAPTNNYPTLLSQNGASHTIVSNFCLGTRIDAEADGQPNATATGDDVIPSAADDEDGVTLPAALGIGQQVTAPVFLTAPAGQNGLLNAWVDFNRDGDWADAGEQVAFNVPLIPGNNNVNFTVPAGALAGTTFARFRLSHQTVNYDGFGQDGEVEDYQVTLSQPLDFSDAPAPYPTLLADNGARHTILQGFFLGARVDPEPDGQPNATATGDDINPPAADDEDGVVFTTPLVQGRPATVAVTASASGFLNAWVDFSGDGDWADSGEQIATALALAPGVNNVPFTVPAGAKTGKTFARFRFSHQASLAFVGLATDGEVEDHQAEIITDRERCDLDCDGLDFWLTFPGNYAPDTNNPVRASLGIAGTPGTIGTVSIPGLGFLANFVIPASKAAYVPLPAAADLGDANDAITNKGIHVVASSGVRVTAFNQVHYTTDSYLALHTSIIGTDYIVLGFGNEHTNVPPLNGSQFAIVGTESNTVVTITPSVATLGHAAGVPFNRVLQPGDCYQLRNTNDVPADLSGTLVRSDKPIGVFGSHQVANIPTSNVWFADYIVEQLLPVNTWGNDFYTAPLATRSFGDTFRCLASQNGTTVSLNGAAVAALNRGQFAELSITNGSRITANKPIFVAQYANSSDYDGVVNADPFMLTVLATRHYVTNYLVCTPTNDFATNYVHIIAPTSTVPTIRLDGAAVAGFTTISGTTYGYRRVLVTPGAHTVTAAAPISVSVYGWAEYESYGHPGCFFLGDVLPPTVSTAVPGSTASVNDYTNTPGFVPTPDVSTGAQTKDNCDPGPATPTQTPTTGTLLPPGVHNITLAAQDSLGNIGLANFTFTVLDPSPVVITCPSNIVVNCGSNNGATVTFTVTAHSTYDTNVPVVSTPASGSFFSAGTTTVTNVATSLAGLSNSCTFTVTVLCDRRLNVSRGANGLTLSWTGNATLQFAPNVTGPWSNVVSGVSSYVTSPIGQQGYFRVRY